MRPSHAEIIAFCNAVLGGDRGLIPLADFGYNRGIEDAAGWVALLSQWLAEKEGATVEEMIASLELLISFLKIIQSDVTRWPDLSLHGKAMRAKWSPK